MLIDGIHVPLTAPFYRDGSSYFRKLEHNVGRYSLGPAAGLVALPPGGEGNALNDAEIAETLKIVGETAAPEKVLVAGVTKDSVRGALWVAEQAASSKFDALLVSVPRGLNLAEMRVFFGAVADSSPLPLLLHGTEELNVDLIGELAGNSNVIGIYAPELTAEHYCALIAATHDVRREVTVTTVFAPVTKRMKAPAASGAATFVSAKLLGGGAAVATAPPVPALKTRTKTVGFQVMSASGPENLVELLEAGAAGALPRLAACAPQACHEVFAAFKDGDPDLAREKSQRLLQADALMHELGVAGVKYACDLNGYYGGAPRMPKLPLDGEQRKRVEQVMVGLRA